MNEWMYEQSINHTFLYNWQAGHSLCRTCSGLLSSAEVAERWGLHVQHKNRMWEGRCKFCSCAQYDGLSGSCTLFLSLSFLCALVRAHVLVSLLNWKVVSMEMYFDLWVCQLYSIPSLVYGKESIGPAWYPPSCPVWCMVRRALTLPDTLLPAQLGVRL